MQTFSDLGQFLAKIAIALEQPDSLSWDAWETANRNNSEPRYLVADPDSIPHMYPDKIDMKSDIAEFVAESVRRFIPDHSK